MLHNLALITICNRNAKHSGPLFLWEIVEVVLFRLESTGLPHCNMDLQLMKLRRISDTDGC